MRRSLLLSALLLALPALAHAQDGQRPEVTAAAQRLQAQVVEWRRDFHQHPELSNREARTSAEVAKRLRAMGLKPKTGIAHHGVVAIIEGGKPGPKIALRADMDALPVTEQTGLPFASKATDQYRGQTVGVMHACGHDAHTATLLGVAEALVSMKKDLPGQVMLIFQPAEEGAPPPEEGGAALMLKEGLFADFKPEAVFGLHVFSSVQAGQIAVRGGPLMAASDRFGIKVIGRQTHGSAPWNGVDPIVATADLVGTAQTIVSRRANLSKQPAVLTFGAINGGIRYNIIPDEVEMVGTIRTFDEGMRQQIFADLRNVAEHTRRARCEGGDRHLRVGGQPGHGERPGADREDAAEPAGGGGQGQRVRASAADGRGGFSLYAKEVPGMFFFVGSTSVGIDPATAPANHSPKFLLDEKALDVGLRALLQVSLDYLHGAGTPAG